MKVNPDREPRTGRRRCMLLFRLWCAAVLAGLTTAQAALAAGPIVQVTADGTSSVRPAWSPDGSHIAFQTSQSNAYHVYTMAADGSDRRPVSQGDVDDRHAAWSPDGKMLAVDSGTDLQREVTLIDLGSGARTQITSLGAFASFPSWSPDGSRLSFYVYQNGTMELWTVNRDGSKPVQMTQGLASETRSQCTFACHGAAWSQDGTRLAFADGDQKNVLTMRSDDGSDQVKVSADDPTGRSHFPAYLHDGRLAYVTEHINPGQSWTDVWAVTPGSNQPPVALLQDVQVQGPFDFSPDQQKLLFFSPRNGNFDIYIATLDASGKDALKKLSSDTELAPALAAAGHPAGASVSGQVGPSSVQPAAAAASAASAAPPETGILPAGVSPYVVALAGLAVIWVLVEGVVIARRRRRRRDILSDGQ
jgi:Tol biopolymer transport system component